MTKDELKQVEWYEYKCNLVSVEDKIQATVENQLVINRESSLTEII
jgi:hypothetical protein